jgi:peptide/nickel transport system permease protein
LTELGEKPEVVEAQEGIVTGATWSLVPRRRIRLSARWRNPIGLVGAGIVGFNILVAMFGPFAWDIDPNNTDFTRLEGPSWAHPFGTDDLGRDTLARIIHGSQVSLEVGAVAMGIAFAAGLLIGLLSAYYRGYVDGVLMRVVDMLFALPALIMAIVIAGLLGPTRTNAMIAIGIAYTPAFARVVRAAVLEVMGFPFVESARALGAGRRS